MILLSKMSRFHLIDLLAILKIISKKKQCLVLFVEFRIFLSIYNKLKLNYYRYINTVPPLLV